MRGDIKAKGARVGRGQRHEESIDTSATDWQSQGKCAQPGAQPDDWFPEPGLPGVGASSFADDTRGAAHARMACAGCPVMERCLLFAIDNKLDHGVFGGRSASWRTRNGARLAARRDAS